MLTNSGTASLEMSALLSRILPDDEVIMPSYTFSSTANAFILRGAKPIFVDININNLNIDEMKVLNAITNKTKVIVLVHYGGTCCDIDLIKKICIEKNILLVEDAAQGFLSYYKNKHLGTIGDLGAISFHESKNITCGEGGALLVNKKKFIQRAKILREKGTNRSLFFEGKISKYNWVDLGSSFLMNDFTAAILEYQIEISNLLTKKRLAAWNYYYKHLSIYNEYFKLSMIKDFSLHNAHIFFIILNNRIDRTWLIDYLRKKGISAYFHYSPLHSSPAGKSYGISRGSMKETNKAANKMLRLPLWSQISRRQQDYVIDKLILGINLFFTKNN